MKFTVNLFLIFLVVPLFLIGLLATTLKFQLLNLGFWENTFERYKVYSSSVTTLKKSLEDQTVKEGGARGDVMVLTNIITEDNLRDFINKNLKNILDYANESVNQLVFYVPISKIPKALVPGNLSAIPEQVPVNTLLSKFNITGITNTQIQYISLLGRGSLYFLILDSILVVTFLILLFVLVTPGARFIAPGIALLVSGVLTLGIFQLGSQVTGAMAKDLVIRNTTVEVLMGTIIPPLTQEILKLWLWVGLAAVAFGTSLFFFRKPGGLQKKTS